jgi:nitrate reductase gamma subunit
MDPLTKDFSRELEYNFIKRSGLETFKRWKSVMMITIPSWLKISRSRFKWKTKPYSIVDPLTKDFSRELVYNFIKRSGLETFKRWKSVMMITIHSWLKISRSRFKWKTKSYSILDNTRKLLFHAHSYNEISVSYSVINGELSS